MLSGISERFAQIEENEMKKEFLKIEEFRNNPNRLSIGVIGGDYHASWTEAVVRFEGDTADRPEMVARVEKMVTMFNKADDLCIAVPYHTFPKWMGKMPRQNTPWNDAEDAELVVGYKQGMDVHKLIEKHGRAYGGIDSRLSKLLGAEYYETRDRECQAIRNDIARLQARLDDYCGK
jgi:hypothetical protein